MKPNYTALFKSFVKKQHKPLQLAIEDAVEDVCNAPEIGEQKTGDLQGIYVHKFKFHRQQYLIAYRPPRSPVVDEALLAGNEFLFIDFYQIGTHENFYADLKKYLNSRGL